ncbi:MAG: DUF1828 domain-containing protein [Rhodocyclales bacterium]|nr:DUF1828 domain-containing protein [Rhodocyclales bacterium]MBI5784313.1 DUF1828 domain-containing protein [Rhodocyclales bacterium]
MNAPDLAREYLAWLKERLLTVKRGEVSVLSTPFLDPFHDGIEIYCESHNGDLLLHDGGKTFDNLLDMGIQIDSSERRQQIVAHAIAGCGVEFSGNRLQTMTTPDSLAQRAHFLLTAIARLNDLWMSAAPRSPSDFFALVKEYMDQQDVRYIANVPIQGRTVAHMIDFVISLGKGKDRLIKLIGSPTLQSAKLMSFTWMELREARPDSQRVVLLNDTAMPDAFADEEEPVVRGISEQTGAILHAYSDRVLAWSAHNDDQFLSAIAA